MVNKIKVALFANQINFNNLQIVNDIILYNNENLIIQTPLFEEIIKIYSCKNIIEIYFKIPLTNEGNSFVNFINDIEKYYMEYIYYNKDKLLNNFDKTKDVRFRSFIKIIEHTENKIIKLKFNINTTIKRLNVESKNLINYNDIENISINDIESKSNIRLLINIRSVIINNNFIKLNVIPILLEEISICEYKFQNITLDLSEDNNSLLSSDNNVKKENNIGEIDIILNDITTIDTKKNKLDFIV